MRKKKINGIVQTKYCKAHILILPGFTLTLEGILQTGTNMPCQTYFSIFSNDNSTHTQKKVNLCGE